MPGVLAKVVYDMDADAWVLAEVYDMYGGI